MEDQGSHSHDSMHSFDAEERYLVLSEVAQYAIGLVSGLVLDPCRKRQSQHRGREGGDTCDTGLSRPTVLAQV